MIDSLYPNNWKEISLAVKEACGWRCLACGKQCRRQGELNLGWQFTLHCAHIDQNYDSEIVTVAALCLPCHFRFDAPFVWVARRRRQRIRQHIAGQLAFGL